MTYKFSVVVFVHTCEKTNAQIFSPKQIIYQIIFLFPISSQIKIYSLSSLNYYYNLMKLTQIEWSRKLPALRLLIFPPAFVFAYSAFCYYRQKYEESQLKQDKSVKIIKAMLENSQKARNFSQLQNAYQNMCKYTSKIITDPSQRKGKVLDSKMNIVEERGFWSSRFKMEKDIQNNQYNYERVIKQGIFSIGFWTNISETKLHKIEKYECIQTVLKKAVKNRQKRCVQIADNYASNLHRGYHEVYEQCLIKTIEPVAQLNRHLDLIQKMRTYQPNF